MIKDINQLFKVKHIKLRIKNWDRLLKINKLFPDDFSRINFQYQSYYPTEISEYSISEIMDNSDWINLKFIQIYKSINLSSDEFQFWWMMLRSGKTRFNLTRITLKFSLLSECLTVLSLCSDCPELKSVKLQYWKADAENEDEAVEQAKREFKQKYGFIENLIIRKD